MIYAFNFKEIIRSFLLKHYPTKFRLYNKKSSFNILNIHFILCCTVRDSQFKRRKERKSNKIYLNLR